MSDALPGPSRLLTNGTIWMGPGQPTATALLIVDGRIDSLSEDAFLRAADVDEVEEVDLEGGFVMASFGEGHAHPLFGGLEADGPQIRACTSREEIVAEVRRYAEANPDLDWIVGASYDSTVVPGGLFDARWLDEAVPDRPVFLRAWDYHTAWVNSVALERAGIDASTAEPALGEIPRRTDGSPLGTLREWGAVDLVTAVAPSPSMETRVAALGRATAHYASLGVTWVQDAWVEPADVDLYLEAAQQGVLKTRLNLALLADSRSFPESLPALIEARDRVEGLGHPLLTAHSVKFFADGVIENETGALLEPYCTGLHEHGMLVWDPMHLAESVRAVDAVGFQAHIHAIGDAAVRSALDAIEYTEKSNGVSDRRAVIAHIQLADGDDLARFARLGVVATMQPLWAQLDDAMTALTLPKIGDDRGTRQYRMGTLARSGATLAFGSDWPVSSAAPLDGIAVACRRINDRGEPAGGWMPEEILDIEVALAAYSAGTARQAFADLAPAPWGQIAEGASADLVWLAADPRAVPAGDLPGLAIRTTWLAGEPTFLAR